eukprot:8342410-Alexandrium_andersonii.AAC.1
MGEYACTQQLGALRSGAHMCPVRALSSIVRRSLQGGSERGPKGPLWSRAGLTPECHSHR